MKWQYGGAGKQTRLHTTRRSTISLVLLKILFIPLSPIASKRHNIKNEHERRKGGVCIFLFLLSSDLHMESFFLFPFSSTVQTNQYHNLFCVHTSDIALFSIICSSLLLSCRTFACCFSTLFLHPSLLIHPSNHP